jgi:hypothetical protein
VEKIYVVALSVALVCAFLILPAAGQVATGQIAVAQEATARAPADSLAEFSPSFGNAASCVQPQRLQVPRLVAKRAKIKAQLMNVLRESIFDDAKGVVNLAREKQIKDLINTLTKEKAE